jgi:hypothetical protein
MKRINLNLDLSKIKISEGNNPKQVVADGYFQTLLGALNEKRGIDLETIRKYSKVADKLDEAKEKNLDEVELSDEQFDFLYTNFIGYKSFSVMGAKLVIILQDELERIKEKEPDKEGGLGEKKLKGAADEETDKEK